MAEMFDGKSILVVDDDPDIISAMQAVLTEAGAEVAVASDGEEAVNKFAEIEPDLVILDAMLHKRSGFLVLEKLKARKKKGEKEDEQATEPVDSRSKKVESLFTVKPPK